MFINKDVGLIYYLCKDYVDGEFTVEKDGMFIEISFDLLEPISESLYDELNTFCFSVNHYIGRMDIVVKEYSYRNSRFKQIAWNGIAQQYVVVDLTGDGVWGTGYTLLEVINNYVSTFGDFSDLVRIDDDYTFSGLSKQYLEVIQ